MNNLLISLRNNISLLVTNIKRTNKQKMLFKLLVCIRISENLQQIISTLVCFHVILFRHSHVNNLKIYAENTMMT